MLKLLQRTHYKAIFLALIGIFAYSCQDDFLEIGSNLVDNVNYKSDSLTLPVISYTKPFFNDIGVQTSGLASGALGIYKDSVYGETTASTLSQLAISPANPSVGENAVIDSVVVTLPYYSTAIGARADGGTEYRLDSVYGDNIMNIRGYRSSYFLSDNNPQNVSESAVYYSNQLDEFNGIRGDLLFSQDSFTPSEKEIVTKIFPDSTSIDTTVTINRAEPAFRYKLDSTETAYIKSAILDKAGSDELFNQNSFKNYFRGLYIEAEPVNGNGSYFLFNKSTSQIQIYYTADGSGDSRIQSSLALSLNPSSGAIGVVGYENEFKPEVVNQTASADSITGDESLFLKGGQGSMAVIDLFGEDTDGDGIPEQLEELRAGSTKLIREARLTFYIDQEKLNQYGGSAQNAPTRIYIYDLATNQPLADYNNDVQGTSQGVTAVGTTHLGPLEKDASENGVRYTIRITEHIKNLLDPENESPSTTLGVVVAQNLLPSGISTGGIENTSSNEKPNRLPITSILSQDGTILHGSASTDANKRLSLKLYFIETPNQ
ncbi:MAG TPA: DUF4270 domain-containing protein [Leeuwenhoekiella sp.]|nr:DUF4270 domain-containing protein [Leeuwenhoekiella sp.]